MNPNAKQVGLGIIALDICLGVALAASYQVATLISPHSPNDHAVAKWTTVFLAPVLLPAVAQRSARFAWLKEPKVLNRVTSIWVAALFCWLCAAGWHRFQPLPAAIALIFAELFWFAMIPQWLRLCARMNIFLNEVSRRDRKR